MSDDHDVVLVPICWDTLRAPGSAAHPAAEAIANSIAAQPASNSPLELPSVSPTQTAPTEAADFDAAPTLILPSPGTPLYNALLEKFNNTGDVNLMESFGDFFVFDKLKEVQEALR